MVNKAEQYAEACAPGRKTDQDDQLELETALLRMTFEAMGLPVAMVLLVVLMTSVALWHSVPHAWMLIWVTLVGAVLLLRVVMVQRYLNRLPPPEQTPRWQRAYVLLAAATGLTWGALALLNFGMETPPIQAIVVLVVMGLVAGGLTSYATIAGAYPVFLSTALVPVGYWLWQQPGRHWTWFTLLVPLFGLVLWRFGERHRRFLCQSLHLSQANATLIKQLSHSNIHLAEEKSSLEALQRLAALGITDAPLEDLLKEAVGIICSVPWLKIRNEGAIFLAEPEQRRLRLVAPWNLHQELLGRCARVEYGHCLCGRAAAEMQLLFADHVDHRHDIHFDGMRGHGHYNVPIRNGDKLLGVLVLYLEEGHVEKPAERAFLEAVADSLAGVIERVRAVESSRIAVHAIEATNDAVVITDSQANILSVNPAFTEITGYPAEEVIGKNPRILRSEHHPAEFYADMWTQLLETGHWRGELYNRRKDGTLFPVLQDISAIRDNSGEISSFVGVFHDITQFKQAEKEMRQLAYFDVLTKLPNRHRYEECLYDAIHQHRRDGQRLAMLFIDIQGFRQVNKSFGYSAGDQILHDTVERLQRVVRANDKLARVGGDEFSILMPQIPDAYVAEQIARRIAEVMSRPFQIEGVNVNCRAQIGIAIYPDDAQDAQGLMACADAALHQVVSHADETDYSFYSEQHKVQSVQRLRLESDLRQATTRSELVLCYQPQFRLENGGLAGAEALIRWRRDGQLVPPGDFIPLAEESGLIVPITEWLLPQVVADWFAPGIAGGPPRVAVNISGRHFGQPERLLKLVEDTLAHSGIEPHRLELEVTESSILDNIARATEILQALRKLGVSIALDDFGTGYSSLSYLVSLPIDILKLDRQFVLGIADNPRSHDVVRGLIMMAHSIGIEVVAEGIETPEQAEALRAMGCDLGQGFLLGRPSPVSAFDWCGAGRPASKEAEIREA